MARTFNKPIPILAHRNGNPKIVYTFDSANKASAFTLADVKSIMQVARGDRYQALGWDFYIKDSLTGREREQKATRVIHNCPPVEQQYTRQP